jgi:hypothetical protein
MPLKVKNIAAGFYDSRGIFHPIRAAGDYRPEDVGEAYKYKKATKKQIREKARIAEETAKKARKERYERLKAERAAAKAAPAPKKKAARKTAIAAARKALKKATAAKKKNPIPVSRWVPAKVRRTKSGDIKIMLPLK